jgi:hypothetical protein
MIFQKIYLFLFLLVLADVFPATKDSCLKINESDWNKVTKDKSYVETFKDFNTKETTSEKTTTKMPAMDLGGFKYVFYILVAGVILFVVVKILQNINSSPAIDIDKGRVYTLSEVEEKILEIDLDKIFNDALVAKDYRLALRINFLIVIKMLSLSGKISWTKEKTNWEYYNEIKDSTIALKFKEIVVPFETIWYGEHELTEAQFNRLQPSYESFKNQAT